MKHQCTIFHARMGWCGFHKKRARTRYAELVFLHPVGSVSHIVHSGASAAQNVEEVFFTIGWASCGFYKKSDGPRYSELVFLHSEGSVGHVVHSGASGP
jgi:hypothetical protein